MAALNKVMLIGNLGRDPEVRMAGESKVANFSIAVTEKFKGRDGQQQEKTEWVNIVFWGRQAEICEQYLRKGSPIYIEGKLETRSWDDKTTGEKKFRTEVRGIVMQMLGSKGESSGGGSYGAPAAAAPAAPMDSGFSAPPAPEDDLPF
ncbi:MAG: single-stranded DNA-binding protein [Fibrobacterales bacterium]